MSIEDNFTKEIYQELKKIAQYHMSKESNDHTLQPTALIHEAYFRLAKSKSEKTWESKEQFFCYASEVMRHILVDSARAKKSKKRGGEFTRIELGEELVIKSNSYDDDILALDEALTKFEAAYPSKAKLIKLRYFCGLTVVEAASTLGISKATAVNYWNFGKAWLHRELT